MIQRPFKRKSGPPFIPKGGTDPEQPYGFMHPCFVDGCEAEAPFGIGVHLLAGKSGLWACRAHLHELERFHAHTASDQPKEADDEQGSSGTGDLFAAGDSPTRA